MSRGDFKEEFYEAWTQLSAEYGMKDAAYRTFLEFETKANRPAAATPVSPPGNRRNPVDSQSISSRRKPPTTTGTDSVAAACSMLSSQADSQSADFYKHSYGMHSSSEAASLQSFNVTSPEIPSNFTDPSPVVSPCILEPEVHPNFANCPKGTFRIPLSDVQRKISVTSVESPSFLRTSGAQSSTSAEGVVRSSPISAESDQSSDSGTFIRYPMMSENVSGITPPDVSPIRRPSTPLPEAQTELSLSVIKSLEATLSKSLPTSKPFSFGSSSRCNVSPSSVDGSSSSATLSTGIEDRFLSLPAFHFSDDFGGSSSKPLPMDIRSLNASSGRIVIKPTSLFFTETPISVQHCDMPSLAALPNPTAVIIPPADTNPSASQRSFTDTPPASLSHMPSDAVQRSPAPTDLSSQINPDSK